MYFAIFITGFAAGMFTVGVLAPWLVADTHDELERQLEEMESNDNVSNR